MSRHRGTKPWAIATAVTLVVGLGTVATQPAAAVPPGDPAADAPLPAALQPASSQPDPQLDGPRRQPPAFTLNAVEKVRPRAGGNGFFDITLARRKSPGVNATNLTVRVLGSRNVNVVGGEEFTADHQTADGENSWHCEPGLPQSRTCQYQNPLASGEIPAGLRMRVRVPVSAKGSTGGLRVLASWTEDRQLPGGTGEAGAAVDPEHPTRIQTLKQQLPVSFDPPMAVAFGPASDAILHMPDTGGAATLRTGSLVATITNLDGRDASATWEQTSGPTVEFLRSTHVDQPADSVGQQFVVPAGTPNGTQLRFKLTVSSTGQTAIASYTTTVRTHRIGQFPARSDLIAAVADASTQAAQRTRTGIVLPRSNYQSTISGRGSKHVIASQAGRTRTFTLTFNHPVGIRSTSWSVVSGPATLLSGSRRTANSVTMAAPRRAGTYLLRATATLKNGHKVSRTKIVRVAAPRLRQQQAIGATSPTIPACSLKAGGNTTFADGSKLTLPTNAALPKACTASTVIAFTNATLTYDGFTFTSVGGTVSKNRMQLTALTAALPKQLARVLPSGSKTSFSVTLPKSAPITSSFAANTWGGWSGSFTVPWLSFVPVPSGWTTPVGTFSLSPTVVGGKVTGADLTFTEESAATDGSGGTAVLSATFSTNGPSDISVTAANLAVLATSTGNQVEFSGKGTFALSKGASNEITFTMNCASANQDGSCPIAPGFALKKGAALKWTQGHGLTLTGARATVGTAPNSHSFDLSGRYRGVGDWSLAVSDGTTPWAIGSTGATVTAFTGSVAEKPGRASSTLDVNISGTVNNLNIDQALTVHSVQARITNTCAASAKGCTPGQLTVAFVVSATANLMGDDVEIAANASLNLTTMDFDFDTTDTFTTDFGPAALNITQVQLTLTNQGLTGACAPTGQPAPSNDGALSLGVAATGTAYGQSIAIGGELNADGYCLWGALGNLNSGTFEGQNIVVAYSSYTDGGTLTLPSNAGDPASDSPSGTSMTVSVPAQSIVLQGEYLPPGDAFRQAGVMAQEVTFSAQADIDLASLLATVDYQLEDPQFIGGDETTDDVGVAVSDVTLKIGLTTSPMQASLTLIVSGNIVVAPTQQGNFDPNQGCGSTPAQQQDGCSYTPVGGSISVSASDQGLSMAIQLGVNTADGPVQDAFGQQGLTIDNLSISSSVGVPGQLALAVNADVTLPDAWTSGVALINNAPVSLAFNISDENPCLLFAIGEEDSATTYLDIDNAGVLTASYVSLVLAPTGCTIPVGTNGNQQVPAGYSFAFDGQVLGDTTVVLLDVSFQQDGSPIVDGRLELSSFDLMGAVSMNETIIDFVSDPSSGELNVYFAGGFSVGDPSVVGGEVSVNGTVDIAGDGNFTVVLGGGGNINLLDVVSGSISSNQAACPTWTQSLSPAPTNCLVAIQEVNGQVQNADVSASMSFSVLDTSLTGQIDLVYDDGTLQDFHLALGANVDIEVGDVSGTVYIDYCRGALNTYPDGSTGPNSCQLGGSTGVASVFLDGSYWIGYCDLCYSSTYSDSIAYSTFSTNDLGSAAASPHIGQADLALPAGRTTFAHPSDPADYNLNLLWNQASVIGWTGTPNAEHGYRLDQNVVVSAVGPAKVDKTPACTDVRAGMNWNPTVSDHNPAPTALAASRTACALELVYATPGAHVLAEPDFGGNGSVIGEDGVGQWAQWASTNARSGTLRAPGPDWFTAPRRGYAVCTPSTAAQPSCTMYDANKRAIGVLISAIRTGNRTDKIGAGIANNQLIAGLLNPPGTLPQGAILSAGNTKFSADGNSRVLVTADGELQVWHDAADGFPGTAGSSPIWRAGGADHPGGQLRLLPTGRLVLEDTAGQAYWMSPAPTTSPSGPAFVTVGGPRGLAVTDGKHLASPLWSIQ